MWPSENYSIIIAMSLAPCLANRVTKLTLDRSRDQEGTHCDSSNILLLYLVQDMDARSAVTKCQIRSGHDMHKRLLPSMLSSLSQLITMRANGTSNEATRDQSACTHLRTVDDHQQVTSNSK
jgi:hypothetical protein